MSKTVRKVIIIVAAIVFIVSGSKLGWHYYQLYVGGSAYDDIRNEVVVEVPPEVEKFHTLAINFDMLSDINPDIVAWLYIPGTPVSYPILCGQDNQTYLTRTYDKKYNILGSIFMDYRSDPEFQDVNTIVYGHNTSSDAMFGSLKKYKEQGYAQEHTEVHIIKKDEVRVYQVFSAYETLATSDTYIIDFSSDESFANYLEEMTSNSVVYLGGSPKSGQILTLSTCTGGNKAMRLVLQAKFIHSHPAE